jgi:hypothetical protein
MQKRERDLISSGSNRSSSKSGHRSLSRENSVGRNELKKGAETANISARGGEMTVSDFMKNHNEEQET